MGYKYSTFVHPAGGKPIHVLGEYRPWNYHKDNGGTASSWPEHSSRIMDVKRLRAGGFGYFDKALISAVAKFAPDLLVVVPGHDPNGGKSGMRMIAERIVARTKAASGCHLLERHTLIEKLAGGGDRAMDIHLESLRVTDPASVSRKTILLLDDVLTTGNSIAASRRLLAEAGADNVVAIALSRTTY